MLIFDYMMWLTITLLCKISHTVKPFVKLTKTPKSVNKLFLNVMLIYKTKKRSRLTAPYLIKLNI